MPEDETRGVVQSAEELTLRHCAYWISLKGRPPTPATTIIRVHVPLANLFSAAAVQGIMQRLPSEPE